jgi:hypothetical protein
VATTKKLRAAVRRPKASALVEMIATAAKAMAIDAV